MHIITLRLMFLVQNQQFKITTLFINSLMRARLFTAGKTSGRDTDKSDKCLRQGFSWEHPASNVLLAPRSLAVLPDCAAHLTLQLVSHQVNITSTSHESAVGFFYRTPPLPPSKLVFENMTCFYTKININLEIMFYKS